MRVDTLNPLNLSDGDIAAWRSMLAADASLSSPYFTPDWAQAVTRRRNDVLVAVYRSEDGAPLAFLPVQRPGAFAALPAGGPICDYQALVGQQDVDLSLAARALGVGRIDLTAGVRHNALEKHLLTEDVGHVARFPEGWDGWCAERQAAGSKVVSRARKRLSKLSREAEGVEIEPFSTDAHAYDALVFRKREQMLRTGVTDIFEHAWINTLVRDTFETPASNPHFGGAMFVLRIARRPAAVLFCLRAQKALHAWFVAHDPKYSDYSPGLILFAEAIKAAAQAGYTEMDLGPGDYRFKESFANAGRPIGAGFIGNASLASAARAAEFQLRALVESLPLGRARQWPAKAMRRLDISRGLAAPADRAA
ncbi:MAG TPA: GNAT family N-acetyltransferase [Hyphomonadaceae bacterium]|jgi:CelD/BcsL family acetyltransferase involved in cellulose biosynthesis|nr:GNAT family N-acetyltransferase [Hyphomonadaceae bacterium]